MTPEALAALHTLCFTDTPRPWTAAEFEALVRAPSTVLAVARGGFAVGRVAGPEVEILTLAVDPAARRHGIATALVREIEARAAARGAEEAFLEVAVTNAAGRALYAGLGYAPVGRRPGYYARTGAPPVDALVMHRRLRPRGKTI